MSGLEWQSAEGSSILHVIDTAKPSPARSGPAALCGRRPQRDRDYWFALSVDANIAGPMQTYSLTMCADCSALLHQGVTITGLMPYKPT